MKTYNVFIDGKPQQISEGDFENYNVIVNKSNGFSHSYLAIEKFNKDKHFTREICIFTGEKRDYIPTHLTTKKENSFIIGSSQVSFS